MNRGMLPLCFVCGILSNVPSDAAGVGEASAENAAIRKTADAFVNAFNQGDAKAVAGLWTEDADYTVGTVAVKGRPAISKLYEVYFREHPGAKMEIKIESIRMLAPTVAIEQGTASVSGSPHGPSSASNYTAVHVKQGDKWLMASVREAEIPTIPTTKPLKELEWLVGTWVAQGDTNGLEMKFDWFADQHFLRGETLVREKSGASPGGMQVIGRDPLTGQIVSWYFSADGGQGYGAWLRQDRRWMIDTEGASSDGARTSATNVLYRADDNVLSWQSVNRVREDMRLPDTKEIVFERVPAVK